MKVQKYENLYSKKLYAVVPNGKKCGHEGYLEVHLTNYPFHEGLRVLVTDGYKNLKDIHCENINEAKKEFRKQFNEAA